MSPPIRSGQSEDRGSRGQRAAGEAPLPVALRLSGGEQSRAQSGNRRLEFVFVER
jgi:hypothetical protein